MKARRAALELLREWEGGSAFAADLIQAAAAKGQIETQDRPLVQSIFYAAIRNRRLIDHLLDQLATGKLDPKTKRILRLGLAEALFLDNPPHALVNETVKQAGWAKGIVNAILRRALREKDALLGRADELPPALRWSVPDFLWKRWITQFGEPIALELARWNNRPSDIYLRLNPFRDSSRLRDSPEVVSVPSHLDYVRVQGKFDADWIHRGLSYAQDPSTATAVSLVEPQPGHRILDACAAPGGKSFALVCKTGLETRIVATDKSPQRVEQMQSNFRRLGIEGSAVSLVHDYLDPEASAPTVLAGKFDWVLVDVPCSNTGVIRRRIDVPWRLKPASFVELQQTLLKLLEQTANLVNPGGTIVYSTCSLDQEENEEVVQGFLAAHPEFRLHQETRTGPWVDGFDGAYAAACRRQD